MTIEAISSTGYTGPVGVEVVTAPTWAVCDMATARARLRIPFTDEDVDIENLLETATLMVEQKAGRWLRAATVRWWYDAVPSGWTLWLPEPIRAVSSVTTYSTADASAVLSASAYSVDTRRHRIVVKDTTTGWPPSDLRTSNALAVEATVGYATQGGVPADLRDAVLLQLMALYRRDALKPEEHTAYTRAIGTIVGKHTHRMGVA